MTNKIIKYAARNSSAPVRTIGAFAVTAFKVPILRHEKKRLTNRIKVKVIIHTLMRAYWLRQRYNRPNLYKGPLFSPASQCYKSSGRRLFERACHG